MPNAANHYATPPQTTTSRANASQFSEFVSRGGGGGGDVPQM